MKFTQMYLLLVTVMLIAGCNRIYENNTASTGDVYEQDTTTYQVSDYKEDTDTDDYYEPYFKCPGDSRRIFKSSNYKILDDEDDMESCCPMNFLNQSRTCQFIK